MFHGVVSGQITDPSWYDTMYHASPRYIDMQRIIFSVVLTATLVVANNDWPWPNNPANLLNPRVAISPNSRELFCPVQLPDPITINDKVTHVRSGHVH